jgi:uncharacterized tellurite resistance protein B-like protein
MSLWIALAAAGIVVAGVIAWAVRRDRRGDVPAFKRLLAEALRGRRLREIPSDLVARMAASYEVPASVADAAVRELFSDVCGRVAADGVVTDKERDMLRQFARLLQVSEMEAAALLARACSKRYQAAFQEAIRDGRITEEEMAQLRRIQADLKLARGQADPSMRETGRAALAAALEHALADDRLDAEEADGLRRIAEASDTAWKDAQLQLRPRALELCRKRLVVGVRDGAEPPDDRSWLEDLKLHFGLPETELLGFRRRLKRLQTLADLRQGNLPRIPAVPGLKMKPSEVCHWLGEASRRAPDGNEKRGTLALTNQRIAFVAPDGLLDAPLTAVADVDRLPGGFRIRRGRGAAWETFAVRDPAAALETLIASIRKLGLRRPEPFAAERARVIPAAARAEVWRRDNGRCAACGSLEDPGFERLKPLSEGGSSAADNLKLLCPACATKHTP